MRCRRMAQGGRVAGHDDQEPGRRVPERRAVSARWAAACALAATTRELTSVNCVLDGVASPADRRERTHDPARAARRLTASCVSVVERVLSNTMLRVAHEHVPSAFLICTPSLLLGCHVRMRKGTIVILRLYSSLSFHSDPSDRQGLVSRSSGARAPGQAQTYRGRSLTHRGQRLHCDRRSDACVGPSRCRRFSQRFGESHSDTPKIYFDSFSQGREIFDPGQSTRQTHSTQLQMISQSLFGSSTPTRPAS